MPNTVGVKVLWSLVVDVFVWNVANGVIILVLFNYAVSFVTSWWLVLCLVQVVVQLFFV